MSGSPDRRLMLGVFAAASMLGFGVFWGGPAKIMAVVAPAREFSSLPDKVASGRGRLEVDGAAVSGAGGDVVSLHASGLTYRHACRDGCDTLVIDYDAPPQAAMSVTAAAADGRPIFTGGAYDDAGETHRLTAD